MRKIVTLLIVGISSMAVDTTVHAAGGGKTPPAHQWSHSGLFGTFDRASLRRGAKVYREVCSSCHGLRLVAYRNLIDIGFSEAEVKAIAAEQEVGICGMK